MLTRIIRILLLASCLAPLAIRANDIEPGKEFYTATKAGSAVVLDGALSEWGGVPVLADPKFAIDPTGALKKGAGAVVPFTGKYVLFEEYAGGTWTGPDDQTSAVQVVWDADNVYFGFVVTDDYHENAAKSAWNGDSIQLMIANGDRDSQIALYNYALGGIETALGDLVEANRHEAGPGGDADCKCPTDVAIKRDIVNKKTIYEIKLPAASLGLTAPLTAGTKFGLGMAINDGDKSTPGQRGWGGLGAHSIVFGKTPSETALITLGAAGPSSDRLFFSAINPAPRSFSFRANDKGTSLVNPASAKLTIAGQTVALKAGSKTGDATDVTYTPEIRLPGTGAYKIEMKDTLGNIVTASGDFTITYNDIEPGKEEYTATRAGSPVVIDGNLSEWAGVPALVDPKFAVDPTGTLKKGAGAVEPFVGKYVLFEEYDGGTWTGPDDQTSAVQVVWDADNVYFGFVVTDDYHENGAKSAWNGDSIQLMIASADRTQQIALYNYALGGVEGALGDVIVNHEAGPASDPGCDCLTEAIVKRDSAKKKTTYEIKLPAAALGLTAPLTGGTKFGLGMAINDGDELTPGQKGWGGLGAHAIVFGKTPSETALLTLGENGPAEVGPVTVQDSGNVVGSGDKAWSYLVVEGESYASETDAGAGVGFTHADDSGTITSFLGKPILAKDTTASGKGALFIQNAAKHGDKATYKMEFTKAGTYYLYMRFSMFESGVNETSYLNEDSFFLPPDFGKDPQTDWPLIDGGGQNGGYSEGCCGGAGYLFIPEKGGGGVRVQHTAGVTADGDTTGRDFWEGNFHWNDLFSSQFLNSATQGAPSVRRKYEVTEAQVGKTLSWTVSNRESGTAVDLWLFSTHPDLMDQYSQDELSQLLLKGGSTSKPALGISLTAGKVTITYTGTLQSSDKANGPYSDVAAAKSPFPADTTAASARFYRSKQ